MRAAPSTAVLADCTASALATTAERMRACVSENPVETEAGPPSR